MQRTTATAATAGCASGEGCNMNADAGPDANPNPYVKDLRRLLRAKRKAKASCPPTTACVEATTTPRLSVTQPQCADEEARTDSQPCMYRVTKPQPRKTAALNESVQTESATAGKAALQTEAAALPAIDKFVGRFEQQARQCTTCTDAGTSQKDGNEEYQQAELQGLQELEQELGSFGIPWEPSDWQITAYKGKKYQSGSKTGWRFTYTMQQGATYSNMFDAVGAAMLAYNCWPTQRYAPGRVAAGTKRSAAASRAAALDLDTAESSDAQDGCAAGSHGSSHAHADTVVLGSDGHSAEHATEKDDSNCSLRRSARNTGKSGSAAYAAYSSEYEYEYDDDGDGNEDSDGNEDGAGSDGKDDGNGDGNDAGDGNGDGDDVEDDADCDDAELIVATATASALQAAAADTLQVYVPCKDGKQQVTALLCDASLLLQGKAHQRMTKFFPCTVGTYRPVADAKRCTVNKLLADAGYGNQGANWPWLVYVARPLLVNRKQLKDRTLAQVLAAVKMGGSKLPAATSNQGSNKRRTPEPAVEENEGAEAEAVTDVPAPKHARQEALGAEALQAAPSAEALQAAPSAEALQAAPSAEALQAAPVAEEMQADSRQGVQIATVTAATPVHTPVIHCA